MLRNDRLPVTVWLVISIVTASITLCLCWWPFNFRAKNDVLVAPEQGKAFFNMGMVAAKPYNPGHAFTKDTLQFDSSRGASFLFLLTPSEIPKNGLGCILTLHDGGKQSPLVIAQWQEHLALFVRAPEAKKGYREVGLRDQLKIGKTVSLTIVSTATETSVLIDGQPVANYPGFSLLESHGQTKGQIILGNNQHGTEPWHGSIERVIIHDQANLFSPGSLPANRPVIDYRFTDHNNETVVNQGKGRFLLYIPTRFVPRSPVFLAPMSRKEFGRSSTWQDVALNIMGFMPISFCFAPFSGRITSQPVWQFLLTVSLAFCFSLIIETGQVFLPSRHSSQLDLLCNAVGGLLVASCFFLSAHTNMGFSSSFAEGSHE